MVAFIVLIVATRASERGSQVSCGGGWGEVGGQEQVLGCAVGALALTGRRAYKPEIEDADALVGVYNRDPDGSAANCAAVVA